MIFYIVASYKHGILLVQVNECRTIRAKNVFSRAASMFKMPVLAPVVA